ncbi:MAG: tetratricopeptide repeat protein [Vicinamibacterales bacterium]
MGALGIAVTALQAAKRRTWKVLVAIFGVVISLLTLVKTQVYDVEHRAYFRAADAAQLRVAKIRYWIAPYANESERQEAIAQVRKLSVELEEIDERLHPTAASSGSGTALLRVLEPAAFAQAQSTKPDWLQGREADANTVYFVGVGINADLATAKRESLDNAIVSAREVLTAQLPIGPGYDPARLAAYLAEAGTVIDGHFERRPDGYRYSTLFALAKRRMAIDARLFGFQENVSVPKEAVQATQAVRPASKEYQARRERVYEQITQHAQKQVNPEVYRLYQAGRSLRLQGDPKGATAPLEEAVKLAPEFFMAWYNLGLAHEAAGKMVEAEEAYKRALALEPAQPTRDASVYNTYGWLLYRQGHYQSARPLFQTALQIDASHPLARRNLIAVEERLKGR